MGEMGLAGASGQLSWHPHVTLSHDVGPHLGRNSNLNPNPNPNLPSNVLVPSPNPHRTVKSTLVFLRCLT